MDAEKGRDSNYDGWSRNRLVLIAFLTIAAYFLWTEHRAHVVQFLPYVLLLLCPLLHLFHGGHGRNHEDHSGGERK